MSHVRGGLEGWHPRLLPGRADDAYHTRMTPRDKTPGRVAGKVALVTGAGSGIGRATALLLAREGANVLCTDRDEALADATSAAIRVAGGASSWCALDVTSESDWQEALGYTESQGGIDVLVNSAGIAHDRPVWEMTIPEWRRVMAVNLEGTLLGIKHGILAMRKHGRPSSIVNLSSVSGIKAAAGATAYCASKAAVCMLSRTAALECQKHGDAIRINCVLPGGVKTPMWLTVPFFQDLVKETGSPDAAFAKMAAAGGPNARFAEPEEVALAILYLASDESRYVTASDLVIDNGGTA